MTIFLRRNEQGEYYLAFHFASVEEEVFFYLGQSGIKTHHECREDAIQEGMRLLEGEGSHDIVHIDFEDV